MAANQVSEIRIEGNEAKNIKLTAEMLKEMLFAVKEHGEAKADRNIIPTDASLDLDTPITEDDVKKDICTLTYLVHALAQYAKHKGVSKQITRYIYEIAYLEKRLKSMLNFTTPEHRAIMTPDNGLEKPFNISEHLGEFKQPALFNIKQRNIMQPISEGTVLGFETIITNSEEHQTYLRDRKVFTVCGKQATIKSKLRTHGQGEGLNNLEKIIYYEAGMTAQGDAVLPHEDRSKRPWYKFAGGVKAKFGCTTEQAEELYTAFDILDTTATMAKTFALWIEKRGVEKAVTYFRSLAIPLMCCTDIGEPSIIDTAEPYIEHDIEHDVDADHPADIADVKADAYHKLDDSRDFAPTWETRQSKEFKFMLEIIRTASLSDLKTIGVALFKEKSHLEIFNKTQTTVIWDEYKRAKARRTPKLRPIALKALERMADKKVNLAKVANWLHGEGKARLTTHELAVVWDAWKKCRKAYAPKQANLIPVEAYK